MIAFIFDVDSNQFWVENILMAPNERDMIINQEGERFTVIFRLINFSEKIGTHYGIIVTRFRALQWPLRAKTLDNFEEFVTNKVFNELPGLILPTCR